MLLGYFLKSPSLAAKSVCGALEVCAERLIPSLFPFIVLVGIMNGTGLSQRLSRLIGGPIGYIFGVDADSIYAVFLGSLGGFPIGAICVRELYGEGKLDKRDAERLLAISSNASPAFCIAALGTAMLGDRRVGLKLYLCQLAATLVVGLFLRPKSHKKSSPVCEKKRFRIADVLAHAVADGGMTMIKICSFSVFFAVVGDFFCYIALRCFGNYAATACAALCELTLAGRYASELDSGLAAVVAAFAVGWSGVSVHMQTASVLSGSGLSMSVYSLAKFAQGVISALIMWAAS